MPTSPEYKVLKHFQWGRLKLEPGQIIVVDANAFPDPNDTRVLIYLKHYRHIEEKTQPIGNQPLDSFIEAGYIKRY